MVSSISWTSDEISDGKAYVRRTDREFQKIGVMGLTVIVASGDQGSSGNEFCGLDPVFSPAYPATSPYVLAAVATMLNATPPTNSTVQWPADICKEYYCTQLPRSDEVACSIPNALITSGGGFSTIVDLPMYQAAAVKAYLTSGVKLPNNTLFNGKMRGYPDVAMLGHNYLIVDNIYGGWVVVDGTSCAAPVWGAIITQLNHQRIMAGKSSLGFVNQLLYQMAAESPSTFYDIVLGNNFCTEAECCEYGYYATKGWDPVTGLGTPNVQQIFTYMKANNLL